MIFISPFNSEIISSEDAYKRTLENARRYVNNKIKKSYDDMLFYTGIDKENLPSIIIEEIKSKFGTEETEETETHITLFWSKHLHDNGEFNPKVLEEFKIQDGVNFINNPLDLVLIAVKRLFPYIKADIQFNPELRGLEFNECGCTTFPNDGSAPLIDLPINIPFKKMAKVLAHELAHVVAGPEHKHDDKWEQDLNNISEKINEVFDEVFNCHLRRYANVES